MKKKRNDTISPLITPSPASPAPVGLDIELTPNEENPAANAPEGTKPKRIRRRITTFTT